MAPIDEKDSSIALLRFIILSENNFVSIPIDVKDMVISPAKGPGPVTLINIRP